MKKKMIIAAVFVCALALTASVTFAHTIKKPVKPTFNTCCVAQDPCCPDVDVNTFNGAMIMNSVMAVSNTGGDVIKDYGIQKPTMGFFPMPTSKAEINTGDATAINDVQSSAATDVTVNAPSKGSLTVNTTSVPKISNVVSATSVTGLNYISKSGEINTGDAGSQNGVLSVADTTVTIK